MASERAHRAVGLWLLGCASLVWAMIVVGGITRLTHAGLSITEWKPVVGTLPPIGEAAWQEEFHRYQASPEYRLVNQGMDLAAFQRIFWIEYGHRLLGRGTGLAFLLPMLWFLRRGLLDRRRATFTGALLALGGLQGAMGWFMVKSGLVDVPRVSPYRLAMHLTLALLLLVLLAWGGARELRGAGVYRAGAAWGVTLAVLGLTAFWGALMAGLRAGLLFPSFPAMAGAWFPPGMLALAPAWLNPTENAVFVHFFHRLLALVSALLVLCSWWCWRSRLRGPWGLAFWWTIPSLLGLQLFLGATTVLRHVPLHLASMHQAVGALLIGAVAALGAHLAPPPAVERV